MSSQYRKLFILITGMLLLQCLGCSNINVLRTRELRQVQKEVRTLKAEIKKLQQMMGTGFNEQLQTVRDQQNALNRMKADIQSLISSLERQLAMLEGRLEESQHRLQSIARMTDRIDSKEFVVKGGRMAEKTEPKKVSTKAAPRVIVKEKTEVDKLYQLSYQDFQSKKYDLAKEGFAALLKNYPTSDLADNAQYWIAECYYIKKDFRKAGEGYQKVISNFPAGNKVPSALYKLGLCYGKTGNMTKKKREWERLISSFPGTNEANLAKEKLREGSDGPSSGR